MKSKASPLPYDTFCSTTQQKSKYDLTMQINLMNEHVDELKTSNQKKHNSVQYNTNCKLTTIL